MASNEFLAFRPTTKPSVSADGVASSNALCATARSFGSHSDLSTGLCRRGGQNGLHATNLLGESQSSNVSCRSLSTPALQLAFAAFVLYTAATSLATISLDFRTFRAFKALNQSRQLKGREEFRLLGMCC